MKNFKSFFAERCWPGYKPTPGKKAYSKGSCVKEETVSEDLRKWFSKTDPKGGWKRINSKGEAIGPCAREPGEPKPKCMSNEKRASLSKKERAATARKKVAGSKKGEQFVKNTEKAEYKKGTYHKK